MSKRNAYRWLIRGALAFALLDFPPSAASSLKLFDPLPLEAAASSSRLVLDRDGHLLRAFTTPDGRWRLMQGLRMSVRPIWRFCSHSRIGGSGGILASILLLLDEPSYKRLRTANPSQADRR